MKVLIIATYFPPDTAIAAVRPYMFAKYLKEAGHDVTVLRSGELSKKPEDSQFFQQLDVPIYSYLGSDSPAERHARGEWKPRASAGKSRIWFIPYGIRRWISKTYHYLNSPIRFIKWMKRTKAKFAMQMKQIDQLAQEKFDVVFSTYGELENVYAGEYAAKKFGCRWILDFRDLIAQRGSYSLPEYLILRKIQKKVLSASDLCTVISDGLGEELRKQDKDKEVVVLYNGYEETREDQTSSIQDDILRFCYTGMLYKGKRDASALFKAIALLIKNKEMDQDKVRFDYAGAYFEELRAQAGKYGLENILVDHGYIDRKSADRLQREDDIFVVLTWNTRKEQGILTGKFYEGLRDRRPIMGLVKGERPNSEIRKIIERYNLGICYEEAWDDKDFSKLTEYVRLQYKNKQALGRVVYEPDSEAFKKFEYRGITRNLEEMMLGLL